MFNVCGLCANPLPTMEAISAPYVVTAAIWPAVAPEIENCTVLSKNETPYNPRAWHLALQEANLIPSFPNLIHDLVHSTPIGNLPPLIYTFIPSNFALAKIDPDY